MNYLKSTLYFKRVHKKVYKIERERERERMEHEIYVFRI